MWIINTRPKERAQILSNGLKGRGYQVFELPLLDLVSLPLDLTLQQQFVRFLDAELVVVVSPIAVTLGMQYYQALNLPMHLLQEKHWICVGQATQAKLQEYGIQSESPKVETSEGMLQLPRLNDFNYHNIAFWRGIGGRTLMMRSLQDKGINVLNMLLYQRIMPDYSREISHQVAQCLPAGVLITSEASWENWLSLCVNDQLLSDQLSRNVYIVLGERVTNVVKTYFAHSPHNTLVKMVDQVSVSQIHQQLQQCWSS